MSNSAKKTTKKLCISSLVLGIIGLVFSIMLPMVTYSCAIPGLLIGLKKNKKGYNSSAGVILSVIAIAFAGINSALGILTTIRMYLSNSRDRKSAM